MSAEFLRELAEIIHYMPTVTSGLTELHVEALRDTADELETQAKEIHERANAQLEIVADKERLIYWALRMIDMLPKVDGVGVTDSLVDSVSLCLNDLGYAPDSNRAIRMLDLGEPARRST